MRKHRFESFNQRIAKLHIDPIHRARRIDLEPHDLESTTSYLQTGLHQWKDSNLSENFSNFVRKAEPLCQSLPQILHYQNDIMTILVDYIEKRDPLSLEPLLDLLGRFAHDLSMKFESHFLKAVTLVASLASKHTDVQVIEWSFTCLTWLFKYLSRLLVLDLRPLFHIMAPLLGREPQKIYTTRFAAEAMSFLVRKAALLYHRKQKPLKLVIGCILEDLESNSGPPQTFDAYNYGIMTLLVESIKGVDRHLNSCAASIYRCLLELILEQDASESTRTCAVIFGVTTALIHHTDSVTICPILDVVFESILSQSKESTHTGIAVHGKLLFIVITVRRGSRVQNWLPIFSALMSLLQNCKETSDKNLSQILNTVAVIMQLAPLEIIIPRIRPIMDRILHDQNAKHFLPFCNFFCDLGQERFHDLIFPYFSSFIISHWEKNELALLLSMPKIIGENLENRLSCPSAWQQHIIKFFERLQPDENTQFYCRAYLEATGYMSMATSTIDQVIAGLGNSIHQRIHSPPENDPGAVFYFGQGLKFYIINSTDASLRSSDFLPLLYNLADHYGTLPPYLEAILLSVESRQVKCGNLVLDSLIDVLVKNLHSSHHILRDLSLRILRALLENDPSSDGEILTTALAIENSPLDLQSARTVSMHIRKLSSLYKSASSQAWIQRAIPHFCFGLLTYRLSQVSDDAIVALKEISETKYGENIISDLAFQWIEEPEDASVLNASSKVKQTQNVSLSNFQCSNLTQMENLIKTIEIEMEDPLKCFQQHLDDSHPILTRKVPEASVLAFRVFSVVPRIAEKRSRQLVPMFLRWGLDEAQDCVPESLEGLDAVAEQKLLARKDRKAVLDLFGLFSNPRVLYRSSDVFKALRNQLANGDVEMQRSALKALFNWKIRGIQPYEENLINLLDDSKFREEISIFLHDDIAIQADHRQDLVPILLRILYGKMIAGSGPRNGKSGQAIKRRAVLEALSRFEENDLHDFVHLILGPLNTLEILKDFRSADVRISQNRFSARKQVGFLNMMKDMLETLGSQLAPFAVDLTEALLYCLIRSARELSTLSSNTDPMAVSNTSLFKTSRQIGLQCLILTFSHYPVKEMEPYVPTIFAELISPRLERLPIDTAQSVSGLLRLFSTWASSKDTVHFLAVYDTCLIKSVVDCLEIPSAKEEVKLYILDEILKRIISQCMSTPLEPDNDGETQQMSIRKRVLSPNVETILSCIDSLLRKSPSKELLSSAIELVSLLAPLIEGSSQAGNLLEISTFLLDQPSHRVNPRSKGDLLQIIQHFLPLVDLSSFDGLQDRIFCTLSSLFGYFKDRTNRLILSRVLSVLAEKDPELRDVATLCINLNSFSERKLDEPDFHERLRAFNMINEIGYKNFSVKQWRPLVYNMLYYIKDTEELAIRSNASFALRRFVETNKHNQETDLIKSVLLPALRNGAFELSELVRAEYLAVMAHLIRYNPEWEETNDMLVLLVSEDEEASFFGNVLHIQQHRRLRALRRLASEAHQLGLRSANVAHFFIPLIEHFIFNKAEDESAHNLAAETVVTIGALTSALEWPQFRALFRRYNGYILSKPDLEKTVIKLLGAVIDTLSQAAAVKLTELDIASAVISPKPHPGKLSATLPRQEKFTEDLTTNLLPLLLKYLHDKDESTVSLRVPVAVSTVKLLKLLPSERLKEFLPAVLTDVCNILRSRSQESRDITRKTLVNISTLIGPQCFGFILKELRSALARGYQLHVLSFTVHSILVATSPIFKPGDLDYCLPQIVTIIMDDIFGATGLEKDAEEYISKMKEVKSSKSYDSMELISKTTSVENFVHLIRPLQTLLEERLDLKTVKKIDELLRRVAVGLLRNEAIQDRQVLVFCHEIIQEVYQNRSVQKDTTSREDHRNKRFLINSRGASKSGTRGTTSSYRYKLARFSLDVLRSVLHKYDSLQTPTNMSGFIPIIGSAISESNEEIQISALRLLTTIIKVPLQEIDKIASICIAECVKIFKALVSTTSELAQAALKLVSSILRERKAIEFKEKELAYLLKRLLPDLEEPDRQGVVFNFLKAIMTRKVIIAEFYEVLDAVAVVMVTNQTRGARDLARGVYFQFLMEYPQGKGRFSKQLEFLARNLDYKHQEGRQSVMEIIHLLFLKMDEDTVQVIVDMFMVPLVMVIVNDESTACREMAGALLKKSIERADARRIQSFLTLLRNWLDESEQPLLIRASLQLYNLYLDAYPKNGEKEIILLRAHFARILKINCSNNTGTDWELLYSALQTFAKITQLYANSTFEPAFASLWASIRQCLSFPHTWVKLSAAKLLGTLYADFARKNADTEELELPLQGSGGLWLKGNEIVGSTIALLALLKVPGVSEELANQSVRNLIFLGRIVAKTSLVWHRAGPQLEIESPDDNDDVSGDENTRSTSEKTALAFIFERSSALLRRRPLTTKAPSLIPLKASLMLITALCTSIPLPIIMPHIPTILLPLHNLTDPTIAAPFSTDESFTTAHKALVANSAETMALLQKKLGTTEYVRILASVREGVRERREGRRVKRRIAAVVEPEKNERGKRRKGERKRERRKEKSGEERGRRRGY